MDHIILPQFSLYYIIQKLQGPFPFTSGHAPSQGGGADRVLLLGIT